VETAVRHRTLIRRTRSKSKWNASAATAAPHLRIGVTGHRRHRLKVPDKVLERRVRAAIRILRTAAEATHRRETTIVSALAEGADEIVASVGLDMGCGLTAVLPFKPKEYETTFSDTAYSKTFRALLAKAHERVVLPGSIRRTKQAYVAVGLETLIRSDIVLTIWDGAPAQGRGGTPEILQAALARRIPIVWIDAAQDTSARLLLRAAFGPCPRLDRLVRRAPTMTKPLIANLVSAMRARREVGNRTG